MREMWCHRVEGDEVPNLVVEATRVLVSTRKETLVLDRDGTFRGRLARRGTDRARHLPRARVGEFGYALARRELLRFAADDTLISRTPIRLDLFARHHDRLSAVFVDPRHELTRGWADAKISGWDQFALLSADPPRERLLATGLSIPPWLVSLRTDGAVDWVLLVGKLSGCCNSAEVVSPDGTLAHFSSCGQRITFITTGGEIVSAHDIGGMPGSFSTEGRDIAHVTLLNEGVAAYRPDKGHVGSVDVPGLFTAQVRDGVLYCVTQDPVAGVLLTAFEEPSLG